MGKKVLMIDADPQPSLSSYYKKNEPRKWYCKFKSVLFAFCRALTPG
jgi:cellulose biosynthesis protein BcsQ